MTDPKDEPSGLTVGEVEDLVALGAQNGVNEVLGRLHPGVVLDPFAGTGTTARVGAEMGRTVIASDLDLSHFVADVNEAVA